jgi:hypothetical protein
MAKNEGHEGKERRKMEGWRDERNELRKGGRIKNKKKQEERNAK